MFPSLELATEDFTGYVGGCDPSYACAYMNTLSWANPTTPLPMEINPRVVFERMFGMAGTAAERLERLQRNRSILDSVTESTSRLTRDLGARDRGRFERLPRSRPRDRAADRAGRKTEQQPRSRCRTPRSASRSRSKSTSPCMFELLALALPDRLDARLHVHDEPRRQPARLSQPRHHRAAPRDVAPRQRSAEASPIWSSSTPSR